MKQANSPTDIRIRQKACKFAEGYCVKKEPVHGMPHICRMLEEFDKFKDKNKNLAKREKAILTALEIAIILHDVGRSCRVEGHGTSSVEILENTIEGKKLFSEMAPAIQKMIKYAIHCHKPREDKGECCFPADPADLEDPTHITLALLLVFDNIDAIGEVGVYRDYVDFKGIKSFNDIRSGTIEYFDEKEKGETFLERLIKNYLHIDRNISRIKRIKSYLNTKALLKRYTDLKLQQECRIIKLIALGKLKIKDEEDLKNTLGPSCGCVK